MNIPFLTIDEYSGKTLAQDHSGDATGNWPEHAWLEQEDVDAFSGVFKKVEEVLGEGLFRIELLPYESNNGFDNKMFRLKSSAGYSFLKILGKGKGNRRELFVWKALGYGADGKRQRGKWFAGIPPKVYVFENLNAVLLPYYEGQLKIHDSGAYEFPMALAVLLCLAGTLDNLHEQGMLFMDICPENILYTQKAPDKPITFFLTDMGSVKTLEDFDGDHHDWDRLKQEITPRRITRQAFKPDGFQRGGDGTSETDPAYDYHTLAKTALVLLGLDSEESREKLVKRKKDFDLEDPMKPRLSEINELLDILNQTLEYKDFQRERLYQLFQEFYTSRASFIADFLDHDKLRDHWQETLLNRFNRYKMALILKDRKRLEQELITTMEESREGGASQQMKALDALPQALVSRDFPYATRLLEELEESRLVRLSRTARYSCSFHKKALRALARKDERVRSFFQSRASDKAGSANLYNLPERETIHALRTSTAGQLGVLIRALNWGAIHE